MVRLAQWFSMRTPLIDGHGNFGNIDGDGAAAMRYTESRLAKPAMELLRDLQKDTVDWQPNYDESLAEPVALPARFPNLLVNGSQGIAVGMATNIAPHNLTEAIEATCYLIDNPDATVDELMQIMRNLAAEGKSILFISHKLAEIMAVADRCSVLRKGKYIGTVETANTTMEELSAMMVGRSVSFHVDKKPAEPGEVVLEVEGMTMASKLHKNNAVKNVSLKVRRGEIVCLAGIDGRSFPAPSSSAVRTSPMRPSASAA